MFCGLLLAALLAVPAETRAQTKKPRRPNPVFAPVKDNPELPRVLLLGDSISIGYTLPVREILKGKANVHRAPTNCGPTTRGLAQIEAWIGNKKWDVIHFNFGLHDLKYIDGKGKLVSPTKGEIQVPLENYTKNLRSLVERLRKTGARLIWCSTTPVPKGARGRIADDSVRYNQAALAAMKDAGKSEIAVNDLHAFAKARLDKIQRKADVHFTRDGSKQLANEVAKAIETALNRKKR